MYSRSIIIECFCSSTCMYHRAYFRLPIKKFFLRHNEKRCSRLCIQYSILIISQYTHATHKIKHIITDAPLPMHINHSHIVSRSTRAPAQPHRIPEWKECSSVHARIVGPAYQCSTEHWGNTIKIPRPKERGDSTQKGSHIYIHCTVCTMCCSLEKRFPILQAGTVHQLACMHAHAHVQMQTAIICIILMYHPQSSL